MSKYDYHLTGQNSHFAKVMAEITHYRLHSVLESDLRIGSSTVRCLNQNMRFPDVQYRLVCRYRLGVPLNIS